MSVSKGLKVFKAKCRQCHVVDPEGGHKQGPNLHGLIGREAGTAEGFSYSTVSATPRCHHLGAEIVSQANKDSRIVWREETLLPYLECPGKYLKGTKKGFAGLKKEQERLDLVAYLSSVSSK